MKVLLVDLFTTLLVLLVAYAAFHWLKSATAATMNGLGAGGLLGLAMLVRLETSVFIPALLLLLFLVLAPVKSWKLLWVQSLTFLLGMALVISPWVVRNWSRTGEFFIDSPGHRQSLILQRFILWKDTSLLPPAAATHPSTPAAGVEPAAGIPTPEATAIHPQPAPGSPLGELSLDPQSVRGLAAYFMAHFLNSQVQSMIYLPATFRGLDTWSA